MTRALKTNPIPFTMKISIVALIMAATLGYSIIKKREISKLTNSENNLILKSMPHFKVQLLNGGLISSSSLFKDGDKAALIHFWGTWCGPCEVELPEFIEFVRKNKDKGLRVLMLAVQDDDKAIRKFLKRFGDLPDNMVVAHDKKGSSMLAFGTVKVPETYLFSARGKNLNKFVGPQTWSLQAIQNRLDFYLSSVGNAEKSATSTSEEKKIETH